MPIWRRDDPVFCAGNARCDPFLLDRREKQVCRDPDHQRFCRDLLKRLLYTISPAAYIVTVHRTAQRVVTERIEPFRKFFALIALIRFTVEVLDLLICFFLLTVPVC